MVMENKAARDTVDILGVPVDRVTMSKALERVSGFLADGGTHAIYTPNSEIVLLAYKQPEFREVLAAADLCVPDGIGVVLASRIFGDALPEKVAGFDLAAEIFRADHGRKLRVFLFGSKPGVAEEAGEKIMSLYPNVEISGTRNGYFTEDERGTIAQAIAASGSDVVLVALGMQKQEMFIHEFLGCMNARIAIGVGGTLDVYAGRVKLAPPFFRRYHLEWFYRLIKQPSRFIRMLALPKFLLIVIAVKLRLVKRAK